MQAVNEPVPDGVLGIVGIGNEAPMQIGVLLGGSGQFGLGGKGLPVVEELAFGGGASFRGRGRQANQALFLQAFETDIGGAQTKLAFAIAPADASAKLLEQFPAWGRVWLESSGSDSLQYSFADIASTHSHGV
jgi:hypothetical protein